MNDIGFVSNIFFLYDKLAEACGMRALCGLKTMPTDVARPLEYVDSTILERPGQPKRIYEVASEVMKCFSHNLMPSPAQKRLIDTMRWIQYINAGYSYLPFATESYYAEISSKLDLALALNSSIELVKATVERSFKKAAEQVPMVNLFTTTLKMLDLFEQHAELENFLSDKHSKALIKIQRTLLQIAEIADCNVDSKLFSELTADAEGTEKQVVLLSKIQDTFVKKITKIAEKAHIKQFLESAQIHQAREHLKSLMESHSHQHALKESAAHKVEAERPHAPQEAELGTHSPQLYKQSQESEQKQSPSSHVGYRSTFDLRKKVIQENKEVHEKYKLIKLAPSLPRVFFEQLSVFRRLSYDIEAILQVGLSFDEGLTNSEEIKARCLRAQQTLTKWKECITKLLRHCGELFCRMLENRLKDIVAACDSYVLFYNSAEVQDVEIRSEIVEEVRYLREFCKLDQGRVYLYYMTDGYRGEPVICHIQNKRISDFEHFLKISLFCHALRKDDRKMISVFLSDQGCYFDKDMLRFYLRTHPDYLQIKKFFTHDRVQNALVELALDAYKNQDTALLAQISRELLSQKYQKQLQAKFASLNPG